MSMGDLLQLLKRFRCVLGDLALSSFLLGSSILEEGVLAV